MESSTIEQLVLHNDYNKLTPEHQSVYKASHSCETALIKLINDILWNMENKLVTVLVCLDLSAAFDTVDHDILLEVLHTSFGVMGTALDWFESYLNNRYFKVSIGNTYSSLKKLNYSVPQESCGGPVLFNCYCALLKNIIPDNLNIGGFADDHTVNGSFTSGKDGISELNCV